MTTISSFSILTLILSLTQLPSSLHAAENAGTLLPCQSWAAGVKATGANDHVELAFPCHRGEARRTFLELADGSVEPIGYELVEGQAVLEGDILLHLDERGYARVAKDFDELFNKSTGRSSSSFRWSGKTVPYTIDSGLPNQSRVTSAIAHWEGETALKFVLRTNQSSYVTFRSGSGCSSHVGRQGGQQFINLASGCSTGNTIHEIGHAVGLWHEHTRSDRGNAVTIHWNNIQSGRDHNFQTYVARGQDGFDLGSHDFGSIMHYGSFAFSRNGSATITKLDGSTFTVQRNALSSGDIAGANHMYPPAAPLGVYITRQGSWNPAQVVTAVVSGGTPPYSYAWYRKPVCSGGGGEGPLDPALNSPITMKDVTCTAWHGPFSTSPPHRWTPYQGPNQNIRVDVRDSRGATKSAYSWANP